MEYTKRVFEHGTLAAGATVRDARFFQCSFIRCGHDPSEFACIERTTLERTTLKTRTISALILREVMVDTCKRNPTFLVSNCLFDRVTMKGEFGSWFFAWFDEHLSPAQRTYAAAFYEEVEWALDIREARFRDLT